MTTRAISIRHRLTRLLFLSSSAALALTTIAFCTYEAVTFRHSGIQQLQTLSHAIASNSTAALAFDNTEDAISVLGAFRAEPDIVRAALYDRHGKLFATYPQTVPASSFPAHPAVTGFAFTRSALAGFTPVVEGTSHLGMLYVQSDLGAMYARIELYGLIVILVIGLSSALAYLLSRRLHDQLSRLSLLQQITRATGERQDLPSIFHVVLASLEQDLPIDFGCFLLHDAEAESLTVGALGIAGRAFADRLGLADGSVIPIDQNGLSRCIAGQLVYEPDVLEVPFPFPQRLASAGLRSLVISPLIVENKVFGVMVSTRRQSQAFSSGECEFLRQLSEHVALASHQARLYGALQKAYDDLRLSQHTVMQQERLRALGQMASGIAHDINNAISPVSLYTESLPEREPNLSERARGYLVTIQRAIDDVARTVARMREFYREREAQLTLERVDLNDAVRQVAELTRPRWNDLPQQRGLHIELNTSLADALPEIMGAEHEIRDALTNLIFNAIDAMPAGGTITLLTRKTTSDDGLDRSVLEVRDTGLGMDDDTRRSCLEPFYTTKGERGTGLGLAMVYGMVQRHSAEIEIESAVGVGTTVRLSFPAHTSSLVAAAHGAKPATVGRRLRILLVDDDPVLIKSLQDTLQEDGHVI